MLHLQMREFLVDDMCYDADEDAADHSGKEENGKV